MKNKNFLGPLAISNYASNSQAPVQSQQTLSYGVYSTTTQPLAVSNVPYNQENIFGQPPPPPPPPPKEEVKPPPPSASFWTQSNPSASNGYLTTNNEAIKQVIFLLN